jgi:hypothetical protein
LSVDASNPASNEPQAPEQQLQDIADLPAVEVIGRYAVDLLTVAAVQVWPKTAAEVTWMKPAS